MIYVFLIIQRHTIIDLQINRSLHLITAGAEYLLGAKHLLATIG